MEEIKTSFINEQKLPLVIEPAAPGATLEDLLRIIKEKNTFFKENMLKYGGLLFRGFPINSAEDFSNVVRALGTGEFVDYIGGGSPRNKVKDSVYTSTEAPPAIKIHLHNEMSFAENFPSHIYFFCLTPPEEGGETFIGDAREILKSVRKETHERFVNKGLKYVSRYYYKSPLMDLINKFQRGHKTWIDVFETKEKKEVEEKCRQNNIAYKWNQNDWLEISRLRPALLEHPKTKERVWFNQVHLFDYNPRFIGWWRYVAMRAFYCRKHMMVDEIFYSDGQKISRNDIYHIHDVLDKHSIYFPWKKGDVMALDNILTMHGRAPFKGKRKILTAMTK
jgi:alpha-ketoglutarate-dependent taurine dioxygenase